MSTATYDPFWDHLEEVKSVALDKTMNDSSLDSATSLLVEPVDIYVTRCLNGVMVVHGKMPKNDSGDMQLIEGMTTGVQLSIPNGIVPSAGADGMLTMKINGHRDVGFMVMNNRRVVGCVCPSQSLTQKIPLKDGCDQINFDIVMFRSYELFGGDVLASQTNFSFLFELVVNTENMFERHSSIVDWNSETFELTEQMMSDDAPVACSNATPEGATATSISRPAKEISTDIVVNKYVQTIKPSKRRPSPNGSMQLDKIHFLDCELPDSVVNLLQDHKSPIDVELCVRLDATNPKWQFIQSNDPDNVSSMKVHLNSNDEYAQVAENNAGCLIESGGITKRFILTLKPGATRITITAMVTKPPSTMDSKTEHRWSTMSFDAQLNVIPTDEYPSYQVNWFVEFEAPKDEIKSDSETEADAEDVQDDDEINKRSIKKEKMEEKEDRPKKRAKC